jgi:hypothetical protein
VILERVTRKRSDFRPATASLPPALAEDNWARRAHHSPETHQTACRSLKAARRDSPHLELARQEKLSQEESLLGMGLPASVLQPRALVPRRKVSGHWKASSSPGFRPAVSALWDEGVML